MLLWRTGRANPKITSQGELAGMTGSTYFIWDALLVAVSRRSPNNGIPPK